MYNVLQLSCIMIYSVALYGSHKDLCTKAFTNLRNTIHWKCWVYWWNSRPSTFSWHCGSSIVDCWSVFAMFVNNDQMFKKKIKCFSDPLPHFKDGIGNTQNVFNIFILLTLIGKSRDVFCTNYEPIKLRLMSVGSNPTL